jgi:hypothetical protein
VRVGGCEQRLPLHNGLGGLDQRADFGGPPGLLGKLQRAGENDRGALLARIQYRVTKGFVLRHVKRLGGEEDVKDNRFSAGVGQLADEVGVHVAREGVVDACIFQQLYILLADARYEDTRAEARRATRRLCF